VHYSSIRAALHIASVFAIYLSLAMLIPAAVDLYFGNDDWRTFAVVDSKGNIARIRLGAGIVHRVRRRQNPVHSRPRARNPPASPAPQS
jgi:hypothetical protein